MNVLEFAQSVDRCGQQFYQEMSSKAHHPGLKKIFTMLAADEKTLLNRLQSLGKDNAEYALHNSTSLKSSDNVFQKLIRRKDHLQFEDDVAAYQLAVEAERDVVTVYEKALAEEAQPEVRRLLQIIAENERQELEEIEGLYHFVNAPNEYLEWAEFSNLEEFHNFGRDVDV